VIAETRAPVSRWLTIIGPVALRSFRYCIEAVMRADVPGDVIETGVWRGGASMYARAVLRAWNATDRRVWLADSFRGFPERDVAGYPADGTMPAFDEDPLYAVSLEEVRANFERLGLLDDQVRFVKGWFKDTLPTLSGERWSVIRLDGDYYESTVQALDSLYPNLSPGGWTIIDDYYAFEACRTAVDEYRARHGISDEMIRIDEERVMWQRA
jgi:O-methyltransferase